MTAQPQDTRIHVNCKVECRNHQYAATGTFHCQLTTTFDEHELDNIVAEIERAGQDFKRQLTQHVLEAADTRVAAVAQAANPNLRKHGTRPFTIVTRYGEVAIKRRRLFNPKKQKNNTLIPSAVAWKTSKRRHLTADLVDAACKESQQVSYRKATQNLADTAGLATLISTATVWNKKQQRGKELKATQKLLADKMLQQHKTLLVKHNIVPSLSDPTAEEVAMFPLTPEQEIEVEELFHSFTQQEPALPEKTPSAPVKTEAAATAVELALNDSTVAPSDDVIVVQLDEVLTKSQEADCKTNLTYTGTVEDRLGRVVHLVADSAEGLVRLVAVQLILFGLFSGKRLEVVSDGARWIAAWATGIVGVEVVRVLCWYHLCKRVYEGLSGLGVSREERKKWEREILGHFWRGEHCLAIWKVWGLRETAKNRKRLDDLLGYLLRKKGQLANYSERRERGEWIASTRVEKWNDIAVAERCKHRGSSWTKAGVLAVAAYAENNKNKHTNS